MFYDQRRTLKHSIALQLRRLRYGKPKAKVFCVGFQKTGTTSLQYALSLLGYRVAGIIGAKGFDSPTQLREFALRQVPCFDAFADNPWPMYYRELDENFPGSKFILTHRDPERWYESVCKHFGEDASIMREWIYGCSSPIGNRHAYVDKLVSHQRLVRQYFAERRNDFLEFDVTEGDGWAALSGFLGKAVPRGAFPRLNTANMRQ